MPLIWWGGISEKLGKIIESMFIGIGVHLHNMKRKIRRFMFTKGWIPKYNFLYSAFGKN